jgi:hypothetical protein
MLRVFTSIVLSLTAATHAVHLRSRSTTSPQLHAQLVNNVPSTNQFARSPLAMLGTEDNANAGHISSDTRIHSDNLPLASLRPGDEANAGPHTLTRIHSDNLPLAILGTSDDANAVPASDAATKEYKHVVVLITGQKSRLEFESKVNHVILPLSEKYKVTVVFSLSNTSHFTNEYKYKIGEVKTINQRSMDDVATEIQMRLNHSIPYYMNDIEYPALKLNNDIVSMYDKVNRGLKFEQKRAINHVRQYYTLSQSLSTVKNLEPDVLIRIRDDAMIKQTFDWVSFLKFIEMSDKNIITHACNTWGGINDKFAIVYKNAISTYLSTPLEVYNTYKKGDLGPGKFINPEQFLSKVYLKESLSLLVYNFQLEIQNQPDAGFFTRHGVRYRHFSARCKPTSDELLRKDS